MSPPSRSRLAVVGAIVVAALSSACCWLPLAAVALGFSAAGVGGMFEASRVPMAGVAVAFLAAPVIWHWRARRACDPASCPPQRSTLVVPVIGSLLVLALVFLPEVLARGRANQRDAAGPNVDTRSLIREYTVEGMTCESCTSLLVGHLEDQPEVAGATIHYVDAVATVSFVDGTSSADADAVLARVTAEWGDKYRFAPRRGTTPWSLEN